MKKNDDVMDKLNMIDFTRRIKEQDINYAGISRRAKIIYWILIPVFLVLIVIHIIEKEPVIEIIGTLCFLSAMLIFGLIFSHLYKEYKYVDYSLPTLEMLKNAANRYKPFQLKGLWLFLAILLIDAGLCLNTSLGFDFVWVQIYFLGAVIIAMFIGLMIWLVKYKPIRDTALDLIREIEEKN